MPDIYVNATDEHGMTALHYAVLLGCRLTMLIEAQAAAGSLEIVKIIASDPSSVLLRANADGNTPLHLAAREGHVEIAQLLVHLLRGHFLPNNKGETPLHLAIREGHTEVSNSASSFLF